MWEFVAFLAFVRFWGFPVWRKKKKKEKKEKVKVARYLMTEAIGYGEELNQPGGGTGCEMATLALEEAKSFWYTIQKAHQLLPLDHQGVVSHRWTNYSNLP